MKFSKPFASLSAAMLVLASACQAVFGDFKVDPSGLDARICEVDEYRCEGERLEVCAPNRSHWELSATCASAGECNLNADTCRPCRPGVERQCNGATLFACDENGQWEKLKDCPTAALCSASAGDCLPAVCARFEHQCLEDGTLQRCNTKQTGWQKLTTCASPASCDAAQARTAAEANQPVTCNAIDGAGATPQCDTPGALRCSRGNSSLERCSEAYQWNLISQCITFALCNPHLGICEPPRCSVGERRCTQDTVEVCREDRTGWDRTRSCPAGTFCDPSAPAGAECVLGTCQSGQKRCNALFVEVCSAATWKRSQRCEKNCSPATTDCTP